MTLHDREGRVGAAIEIHGAQHGLERVGQDRRFGRAAGGGLALAELDEGAEPDVVRRVGQCLTVHDALAQVGEATFRHIGEAVKSDVGDRPPEHGIAEKLEALVAVGITVFGTPRAMSECPIEELGPLEAVSDPFAQLVEVHRSQSLAFSKT